MIILHFHVQAQLKYELFHIYILHIVKDYSNKNSIGESGTSKVPTVYESSLILKLQSH